MFLRMALLMVFSVSSLVAETDEKVILTPYQYLDELAIKAGTDKSSLYHNYTRIYAKYFDSLKDEAIKFLEIGIYKGNSVRLWESYFQNGELHFVDIDQNQIQFFSYRSRYHFVNQADFTGMQNLAINLGGNFDIIIDDGGHRMDQQITSFRALFPSLKSGGLYVIEDTMTSYWSEYGGHGKIGAPLAGAGTTIEFLKDLVDDLNYTAGVCMCSDPNKVPSKLKATLTYYQDQIETIHFYKGLCIIIKR